MGSRGKARLHGGVRCYKTNVTSTQRTSLEALTSAALVGVIRARTEARARTVAEALVEAGFKALEVTADTPGAFSIISELATENQELTVGIGTVLTEDALALARAAQAAFIVSPHTDPRLIEATRAAGMVSIPGAFTATEIRTAMANGADFVKLFPVSAGGGPRFLRTLRGPFPDVPFWVSGDVAGDEIPAFLSAGARLVGLTSALTANLDGLEQEDLLRTVRKRARDCLAVARAARDTAVELVLKAGDEEVRVSLDTLQSLPRSERVSIESVVPGKSGDGVRLRTLLAPLGARPEGSLRLLSEDGFSRVVPTRLVLEGGIVQFAFQGRPLDIDEGGPLRLYLVDGPDRCDNVKGLTAIERL